MEVIKQGQVAKYITRKISILKVKNEGVNVININAEQLTAILLAIENFLLLADELIKMWEHKENRTLDHIIYTHCYFFSGTFFLSVALKNVI